MSIIDAYIKSFNIPEDLKHDHSKESFEEMKEGIKILDALLHNNHTDCINHVLKYSELNIKFLFSANLLPDKEVLKIALEMYIKNIRNLFLRNIK